MDKVQKIREEVVKLKSQLLRGACSSQIAMETRCKEEAYDEVITLLDSMQEEHDRIVDQCIYGKEPELVDVDDLPVVVDAPSEDYVKGFAEGRLYEQRQKPVSKDRFVFKALPRLLDMIEPTDRAKTYTARLADTLEKEGYITDAKIVRERIKVMNGEKVAMAVMDEELASKVWHGVEENPEENKDFAFVDYDGVMWSRYRIEDLFHGWQSFVNMTGMTKWAYTSDLIKL